MLSIAHHMIENKSNKKITPLRCDCSFTLFDVFIYLPCESIREVAAIPIFFSICHNQFL